MLTCAGTANGMTPKPAVPSSAGRNRIQLIGYSISRNDGTGCLAMLCFNEAIRDVSTTGFMTAPPPQFDCGQHPPTSSVAEVPAVSSWPSSGSGVDRDPDHGCSPPLV